MNGKYFISLRPDSYKASQSEKSKISRYRFGICVKFAKIISNQPELSAVWKSAKITGSSSYHRIIKHNIKVTKDAKLSASNIITPEGLNNPFMSIQFNRVSLTALLNNDLVRSEYPLTSFKSYIIIYLSSTNIKNRPDDSFRVFTEAVDTNISQEVKIDFSESDTDLFHQYRHFIVFTSVIWLKEK